AIGPSAVCRVAPLPTPMVSQPLPVLEWSPSTNGHYGVERGRRRLQLVRNLPSPTILGPGWIIYAFMLGLPVWWALGASLEVAPLFGLFMFAALALRGNVKIPPLFGLWLIFLGIALLSAVQINDVSKMVAFMYRFFWYLSVTALFLYILNIPRSVVASATIVK